MLALSASSGLTISPSSPEGRLFCEPRTYRPGFRETLTDSESFCIYFMANNLLISKIITIFAPQLHQVSNNIIKATPKSTATTENGSDVMRQH